MWDDGDDDNDADDSNGCMYWTLIYWTLCLPFYMNHLIFPKALWVGTANDCTTPGGATHVIMYVNGAFWSCECTDSKATHGSPDFY